LILLLAVCNYCCCCRKRPNPPSISCPPIFEPQLFQSGPVQTDPTVAIPYINSEASSSEPRGPSEGLSSQYNDSRAHLMDNLNVATSESGSHGSPSYSSTGMGRMNTYGNRGVANSSMAIPMPQPQPHRPFPVREEPGRPRAAAKVAAETRPLHVIELRTRTGRRSGAALAATPPPSYYSNL
jgi:hypothetical protein